MQRKNELALCDFGTMIEDDGAAMRDAVAEIRAFGTKKAEEHIPSEHGVATPSVAQSHRA